MMILLQYDLLSPDFLTSLVRGFEARMNQRLEDLEGSIIRKISGAGGVQAPPKKQVVFTPSTALRVR
jgi:hypothetical protein